MESAILGLIVDSSIVIEAERIGYSVRQMLRQITTVTGNVESAICAITMAELAHGIHRANTIDRAKRRRLFLDDPKWTVKTFPITDFTAEIVGRVGAQAAAEGRKIPIDDLLIGACALEHKYGVLTKEFTPF